MEIQTNLPTRGQLERQLSQTLQSVYREEFGHLPTKISCHLFSDRLGIIAEGINTGVEKILIGYSKLDLARSIRSAIDETFISKIKQEIEKILQVGLEDIIADSTLHTGYLGIIVFLEDRPDTRLPKSKIRRINNA